MTNYGEKFVVGFTAQYRSYKAGYITLSMIAHLDTNVTIFTKMSNNNPLNVTVSVKGGEFLEYNLPLSLRMSGKQNNGLEISSTSNISVMCLNYDNSYGGDGYLALPTHVLGILYVVPSYYRYDSYARAKIGIVSAHEENNILIKLNKLGKINYGGIVYDYATPFHLALDKLQSVQLESSTDLSGTIIYASKPISVTSSVDRAYPSSSGNIERIESFLLPVTQWGKQYILTTVGSMSKRQGDIFRIFAYEDNTTVESGYGSKVLSSGTYAQITVGQNLTSFVNCSKPCQVVQYIRGESFGGKSAKMSMTVLASVKQFMSYYRVVPSYASQFYSSITITIEEKYTNGLYFDEVKMADITWKRIAGTRYVWTVIGMSEPKIATFYHFLPEVTFGLLIFGWNGAVSYIYPGGLGLKNISIGKYKYDVSNSNGNYLLEDKHYLQGSDGLWLSEVQNYFVWSIGSPGTRCLFFLSHRQKNKQRVPGLPML